MLGNNCVILRSLKNNVLSELYYYDAFDRNLENGKIKIIIENMLDVDIIYNKYNRNLYIEKHLSINNITNIILQFIEYYYDYYNILDNIINKIYIDNTETYNLEYVYGDGNDYIVIINNVIYKHGIISVNNNIIEYSSYPIENIITNENVIIYKTNSITKYFIKKTNDIDILENEITDIENHDFYFIFTMNNEKYILGDKNGIMYRIPKIFEK